MGIDRNERGAGTMSLSRAFSKSNTLAMSLHGDKELKRQLDLLPDKIYRKLLKQAVTAAANPTVKAAKMNAKAIADSGALSKSITKRVKTYRATGTVIAVIGANRDYVDLVPRKNQDGTSSLRVAVPANYGRLLEFGVRPHSLKKGEKLFRRGTGQEGQQVFKGGALHPGFAPKPWLRPAYDSTRAKAQSILIERIRKGLDKLAEESRKAVAQAA